MHMITKQEMKNINRLTVLESIRAKGTTHRSELANELRISLSRLSRIVESLLNDGWILETSEKEASIRKNTKFLKFNGVPHRIIGVDLGGTKIYGAIANLEGKILYETYFKHSQSHAEESYQVVCDVIDELLRVADDDEYQIDGIGIGVPGITDGNTGVVSLAPGLDWQNFPLSSRLNEKYSYPMVVENDVNLAALGEAWYGFDDIKWKTLVLIAIGTGIGAGIIIDGDIYSGIHSMSGEIGYMVLDRTQLGGQYPGFGAFEQIASGTGIAERARHSLAIQTNSSRNGLITSEDVFQAARQKERWAEGIVADTVDYLAQAIASIQLTIDPEIIILGGGVSHSADLLIDPVLQRLAGIIPVIPRLQVSHLEYRAAVLGAAKKMMRITMGLNV